MYSFTPDTATDVFEALRAKGFVIAPGLNDAEIRSVEEAFKAPMPPDLKIFLQAGVLKGSPPSKPVKGVITSKPYYPDWRSPEKIALEARDWIERHVFRFDIEHNSYWYKEFGEKPKDTEEAVQQALAVVRTWPPLFPIHDHRFIPSNPHKAGNLVLSVWQAVDSIPYSMNLLEHMDKEFHLGMDIPKESSRHEVVPYWGEAFDFDMLWLPPHPTD